MKVLLIGTQLYPELSRVRQALLLSGLHVYVGTTLDVQQLRHAHTGAALVVLTKRSFTDCISLLPVLRAQEATERQVWLANLTVIDRERLASITGTPVLPLNAPVHAVLGGLLSGRAVSAPGRLLLGELALEYESRTVETARASIQMSETCFRFFSRIASAQGAFVPYLDLWEELWGDRPFTSRNSLAVVATRTRQLLPPEVANRIQVRYGLGYRLMPARKTSASHEE